MISEFRDDIMGMPIAIQIVDESARQEDIDSVVSFFQEVDNRFSTYKNNSEISQFNRGEIKQKNLSKEMQLVFHLSEETKQQTNGYFNIKKKDGTIDPSGLVKGWAIREASKLLRKKGYKNYFIDAGGDVAVQGLNAEKNKWRVGIRNPFNKQENVKVLCLTNCGIATSGTYSRGQHVYNPYNHGANLKNIVSMSVVGPNVYEADRFATAAFVMQEEGIHFIEQQKGLEGYMINKDGLATMTSGFEKFVC